MGGPSWDTLAADFTDTAPQLADACAAASRATAAADSLSVVAAACAAIGNASPPMRGQLLAPPRPVRPGRFELFGRASPSPLPEAELDLALEEKALGFARRASPSPPHATDLFAPPRPADPSDKAMRSCLAELVAHHRLVTREYEDKVLSLERELHEARTTITKLTERYEKLERKGERAEEGIKMRLQQGEAVTAALRRATTAEERLKRAEAEIATLRSQSQAQAPTPVVAVQQSAPGAPKNPLALWPPLSESSPFTPPSATPCFSPQVALESPSPAVGSAEDVGGGDVGVVAVPSMELLRILLERREPR